MFAGLDLCQFFVGSRDLHKAYRLLLRKPEE